MSSKTKVTPVANSAVLVHPVGPVLEVQKTVVTTTTTTYYAEPSSSNTEIDLDADDHEQLRTLSSVKSWSLPGSQSHGKFALFVTGKNCQVWVIEDNQVIGMYGYCKPTDVLTIELQSPDQQEKGFATVAYTVNGTVRYISKPKEFNTFKPLGAVAVLGGGKSTGIAKFRWVVPPPPLPLVPVKKRDEIPVMKFSTRSGASIRQPSGDEGAIVARKIRGNFEKLSRVQSKQSPVMVPYGSAKAIGIMFSPQSCAGEEEMSILVGLANVSISIRVRAVMVSRFIRQYYVS